MARDSAELSWRLWVDTESTRAPLPSMTDSEDYPLMTVGELARALGVPREFVYWHAAELGAICLRLPDANGKSSSKFERGGPLRFRRSARFALQ